MLFGYYDYAGFDHPKMRQRAIDAGCRNEFEIDRWLTALFGRDQNYGSWRPIPYHYMWPRRRKKKGSDAPPSPPPPAIPPWRNG